MTAVNRTVSSITLDGKELSCIPGSIVHYGVDLGSKERTVLWSGTRLPDGNYEINFTMEYEPNAMQRLNKYLRLDRVRSLYRFFHRKHYKKNGQRLKFRTINKRVNQMIKDYDRSVTIQKMTISLRGNRKA